MLTATIFLIAYFAACALALVRHPIFGLLAYVGVYFVYPSYQWWGNKVPSLRWSLLAAAVTLIAVVIHRNKLPSGSSFKNGVVIGLTLFVAWLGIQSLWALAPTSHATLLEYYVKYLIVVVIIYKSIDNERYLKMFLWVHLIGCFYFGWMAFFMFDGGRFEGFGAPGFSGDANYTGLQAVAGILAAAGLFLAGKFWERVAVFCLVPFVVNGLITTVSRSSFLALLIGGLVFVIFSRREVRRPAIAIGLVGLVGFTLLAHDQYWERIDTITHMGEQVENVDTGSSRMVTWKAQGNMFADHPMGCGHRCTAILSPHYMDDVYLAGPPGNRGRSSHNTYLTLLVEHGVIGGTFALLFVFWLVNSAFKLKKRVPVQQSILPSVLPSVVAILFAILLADVFVDHIKNEIRIWYIAVMLVMFRLTKQASCESESSPSADLPPDLNRHSSEDRAGSRQS